MRPAAVPCESGPPVNHILEAGSASDGRTRPIPRFPAASRQPSLGFVGGGEDARLLTGAIVNFDQSEWRAVAGIMSAPDAPMKPVE